MADTNYRGPAISLGPMMGNVTLQSGTQVALVEPTDGPGVEYQANCFPDPRFGPFNKDGLNVGRLPAFLNSPYAVLVDAIPSASSATPADICPAQNVTSGTPLTFTATQPAANASGQCQHMLAPPLIPFPGSGAVVTPAIGLDMGFTFGTTTAGAAAVVVPDSTLFYVGQWVVIGGGTSTTKPLITQVTALTDATHINVSPAPAVSQTRGPISSANAYFSAAGNFPFGVAATAVSPYVAAGVARIFNPPEAVSRAIGVQGAASGTGGDFKIVGYDIYGVPMNETITATAGATRVYGKKCWKYITSITPQFTDAHNYSFGVADTIGFNLRSDKWEYANVFVGGAFLSVSTGWLAGVTTTASATTGDVRGVINIGTLNQPGAGAAGGPLAGTVRVAIQMTIPLWNLVNATPNNAVPLFGVPQF